MERCWSATGLSRRSRRAIGLVIEAVAHDRLLLRTVELVTKIAEVSAPTGAALKQIYVTGWLPSEPALAAEQTIAGAQALDTIRQIS